MALIRGVNTTILASQKDQTLASANATKAPRPHPPQPKNNVFTKGAYPFFMGSSKKVFTQPTQVS